MNRRIKYLLLIASAVSTLLPLHAQTTTTKASLLGIGSANVLDTYLSPETYSGANVSLITINRHLVGNNWAHQSTWTVNFNGSSNRADNSDYLGGHVDYQYDWLRGIAIGNGILDDLRIGPTAYATFGGLCNTRNGNNPAQLQANAALAATAAIGKSVNVFNTKFLINYQATLPLVGAAFSPQFGQSYYEIFTRGNYDHNIVLASPFNALSFRHMLTVDFAILRHTFRVGYLGDYRQREANSLKFHDYAHMLVIGYVIEK